jgi:hypothetical protein
MSIDYSGKLYLLYLEMGALQAIPFHLGNSIV